MATGTWKLIRVQVGDFPGPVGLACVSGETPMAMTLRRVEDAQVDTFSACITDDAYDCDAGSVKEICAAAGYTLVDDPCI